MNRSLYWQLAGFYFFYFAYIGAFAPYFSLYLDSLGLSAALIGMLMALPAMMRIFASHLWGYLSDRHGRRVGIACASGLVGTLCYLGVFVSDHVAWLFVCIALLSFFWSAALPLMEATTLNHLGERGSEYGRIRLWGSIGYVAAVIGIGWVLDQAAIGVLLWIVAGTLCGILACAWRIPEAGQHAHDPRHEPIADVLRRPAVLALIGACFLMAMAHGPYYTFISLHLVALGYSKTAIGWLWAIGVIAEIAVFACLPWLNRRCSVHRLLVASFALATLRFLLIGWAAHVPVLLVAAQLLHAATFGVFYSAALTSIHLLFRGRNQARGQAVYSSLSAGLGGTIGGLGSGVAWQWVGAGATFTMAAACAFAGWLVLAAWPGAASPAARSSRERSMQ